MPAEVQEAVRAGIRRRRAVRSGLRSAFAYKLDAGAFAAEDFALHSTATLTAPSRHHRKSHVPSPFQGEGQDRGPPAVLHP